MQGRVRSQRYKQTRHESGDLPHSSCPPHCVRCALELHSAAEFPPSEAISGLCEVQVLSSHCSRPPYPLLLPYEDLLALPEAESGGVFRSRGSPQDILQSMEHSSRRRREPGSPSKFLSSMPPVDECQYYGVTRRFPVARSRLDGLANPRAH